MKAEELRMLYKGRGITKQKVWSSFASGNLLPPIEQEAALDDLKEQVFRLRFANYEVVQIDECTFGPNQYGADHWAQAGEPLIKESKYSAYPYISCCGAISEEHGLIHFTLLENQYLNSTHI